MATDVVLYWTSPGDDGVIGTAAEYDIRYSVDSLILINWVNAVQATGEPIPLVSGTLQQDTLTGLPTLSPQTPKIFLAMKARDEAFNWSLMSNVVRVLYVDTIPPAAITNLRGTP